MMTRDDKNNLHTIKDNILAALYTQEYFEFEKQYKKLADIVSKKVLFYEEDQKTINQIQQIFNIFKNDIRLY